MFKIKLVEEFWSDDFCYSKKYLYPKFKNKNEIDTFLKFLIIQTKIDNYGEFNYFIRRKDGRLFLINSLYSKDYLKLKDFIFEGSDL